MLLLDLVQVLLVIGGDVDVVMWDVVGPTHA